MLYFSATTGYPVEAFLLAALEIQITMTLLALERSDESLVVYLLNAAIRKRRHPELGFVSAILELLGNARPPRLIDKREVNKRADVGVVVDQLPLVGAPTSGNLAKEPLSCLANTVRGTT